MNNNDMNIFDYNKQKITDRVEIDQDDMASLDGSVNELIDAGVGKIEEIVIEENDTYNWILLLTNENKQVYYLELSEYGNIIELRKDGPEGDVIQTVLCGVEDYIPTDENKEE